jgi:hypothetical protein
VAAGGEVPQRRILVDTLHSSSGSVEGRTDPLSEVVVGPTPLPENARAAAMQLLRPKPERSRTPISAPADRKIDCEKIVNSKIPFRRV